MVHPNVINIYDIGEFEQNGITKPFFVMPLLAGQIQDPEMANLWASLLRTASFPPRVQVWL